MRVFRLVLYCGLVLILGNTATVVWAHGGGVQQLTNAEAGPYRVSLWTQPDPLRVGEAHFTVAVLEAPASGVAQNLAGPPVLGATVELRFEPENGFDSPLVVLATHEAAVNKLFYEADLELPAEGRWHATMMVEGPAGTGSTDFVIEVASAGSNQFWLLGGFGLIFLILGWIVQRWFWKRQING